MKKYSIISVVSCVTLLFIMFIFSYQVTACKDIVAVGDATAGDYNLLLKVRDPSRPGLQVLCIVPEGYHYTYPHPWTGKPMNYTTTQTYIGIATEGDTIPHIVKAGMTLTAAGLAFGDADTNSNWKNPARHAWDDFDWIRYACQQARTEDEAVRLLTTEAVDSLHATGVSENLFVVGPTKGYVVEADAFHYDITEIDNGIAVMSNYPKELWRTQWRKKVPIACSFNTEKEATVRKGQVLRLGSLFGVRVVDIGETSIIARQVPFIKMSGGFPRFIGERVTIHLGERGTVGDYSVRLLHSDGKKAQISIKYVFKDWEDHMQSFIQSSYGHITVRDMINWSRLHKEDLEGLRPMCEDAARYEAVAVYRIPAENYRLISSGWFSPNHACSSIYVPFHICDTDIFTPYTTAEAATVSLELLDEYGHDTLSLACAHVEDVLIYETERLEQQFPQFLDDKIDVSALFTLQDMSMQQQALLTEKAWLEASCHNDPHQEQMLPILTTFWTHNYSSSIKGMHTAITYLSTISNSENIIQYIEEIALSICKTKIDMIQTLGKPYPPAEEDYDAAVSLFRKGDHEMGFLHLRSAFSACQAQLYGRPLKQTTKEPASSEKESDSLFGILLICFVFLILISLLRLHWKPE